MAADKFLKLSSGQITEQAGATAATPNAIPALDATGRLVVAQMPIGIGPEVKTMPASGALAAGDFVNIYNASGTLKARKADASTTGKEAHGFVISAFADTETATVYMLGGQANTAVTGKTIGAKQFLSTSTPGATQETTAFTSGQICQYLGIALSATEIAAVQSEPIVVA